MFQDALAIAARQEALGWTLRVSLSLAQLWAGQGRNGPALELLASVSERFVEGEARGDLRQARSLIRRLNRPLGRSKISGTFQVGEPAVEVAFQV